MNFVFFDWRKFCTYFVNRYILIWEAFQRDVIVECHHRLPVFSTRSLNCKITSRQIHRWWWCWMWKTPLHSKDCQRQVSSSSLSASSSSSPTSFSRRVPLPAQAKWCLYINLKRVFIYPMPPQLQQPIIQQYQHNYHVTRRVDHQWPHGTNPGHRLSKHRLQC